MRRIYNIIFTVFFWLSAPFYLLKMVRRGRWREGLEQRFGRYGSKVKQSVTNRHVVWLHAVSVGEVNMCTQLIVALERRLPNMKIVVSTTTSTGMAELQRRLPSHIQRVYYPIDRREYVVRALKTIHPKVIVLIEAEIWPNFLWRADEMGIPRFLVNARLSKRSFRGYRRYRFLFRNLFAGFAGVGCQDDADAARLLKLGCRPEAVHVVGNLKYDAAELEERSLVDIPALLRQIGVAKPVRILLGGSTHAGEEAILADVFKRLRVQFPDLFLVLVPRHFERGKEVGSALIERGVKFFYRKDITVNTQLQENSVDCLVVNTTGELKFFYEHATVVFVGKSLTAEGGQNPLEPGALAKPMVFGPNMQNFEAITSALLEQKAAKQVKDAAELEKAVAELLTNHELALRMGQSARQVVRANQGAMDRTVQMIVDELGDEEIYVAEHAQETPQV